MLVQLKFIEICNFKSFAGKLVIGPFLSFGAVVGANGSGKSNMMDAICFVLGEKASNLRVKRLKNLVHGANVGQPVLEPNPYVMAVFQRDGITEIRFTRAIRGDACVYMVNDVVVDAAVYSDRLKQLGVFIEAKNFVIFQDQVQNLVNASPKERTALFERLSRSLEFKEEYDRASEKIKSAEGDLNGLLNKKRIVLAERKSTKRNALDANEYQKLHSATEDTELKLRLFRLNRNEIEQKEMSGVLQMQSEVLEDAVNELREEEEKLHKLKRDHGRASLEVIGKEKIEKKLESERTKKEAAYLKHREKVTHADSKLESARKALTSAEKLLKSHKKAVLEIQVEILDVQKRKQDYENHFQSELQAQGGHLLIDDAQVAEYRRLKECAMGTSGHLIVALCSFEIQQKSDQAELDNEVCRKSDFIGQANILHQQLQSKLERISKLDRYIESSRQELDRLQNLEDTMSLEVTAAGERMEELNRERETILQELKDLADKKALSERCEKKAELIENLKRLFPGVYGRLVDYCHPIHDKYKVALTKVIGFYLDAIICDTHVTAQNCIRYMKDQCIAPETFLPLDYLKVKKIEERLRAINIVRNVKVAFDLLSFDLPQIQRALMFACGDCLVCEKVEDARTVAFDMEERHKTVSLNGVMFHKNGLISGGTSELETKAMRWGAKEVSALKTRKQDVLDEISKVQKILRKKADLDVAKSQIEGLKSRIKFATADRNNVENQEAVEVRARLTVTEQHLSAFDAKIQEISNVIADRDEEMLMLKGEIDRIEDDLFVQFCSDIGVANVREYEEKWLKLREQHEVKLLEFNTHLSRLENQIQFEESRTTDLTSKVQKCKEQITDEEDAVERLGLEDSRCFDELKDLREKAEDARNTLRSLESRANQLYSNMSNLCRTDLAEKRTALETVKQMIMALETRIMQKKAERHDIIKSFKFGNLCLPLVHGSLDDVDLSQSTGDSMSTTAASEIYANESLLEIDYSLLGPYKNIVDKDTAANVLEELEELLSSYQEKLAGLPQPNLAAAAHLPEVLSCCKEVSKEFDATRKRLQMLKVKFEEAKETRYGQFVSFFKDAAATIDEVYRSMMKHSSACAMLDMENDDEPYLGGIRFSCFVPGKRFHSTDSMSGGEKTLAALALLFTLYRCGGAPFLLLDEVDASLDNSNIRKLVDYMRENADDMQCIVITHRKELMDSANALYGCYVKRSDELGRSNFVSLDLSRYRPRPRASTTPVEVDVTHSSLADLSLG